MKDLALDVAWSTGLITLLIAEEDCEVVGLDLSLGQLRRLKEKLGSRMHNDYLDLGDSRKLPFRSSAFNIATCSGIIIKYLVLVISLWWVLLRGLLRGLVL